jgi:signal transduction histidine kinase
MKTIHAPRSLPDLMRRDMLQTVVHDLKTPITVIKGNLGLLSSGMMGNLSAEQMMLLMRSMAPLDDLILMIDNLMQLPQLESNEIALRAEVVDLDHLLAEVVEFYKPTFEQRGMRLFREGNTVGIRVHMDPFWIRRVLNNLIWNAYKFTPDHGQVTVQVQRSEKCLNLMLADTGRGVPADKLETIFEKYKQVDAACDRRLGTGLGLWICKRIMELHGGCIHAESLNGQGSRFVLSFPLESLR